MSGLDAITQERRNQLSLGYSAEHDAELVEGELLAAAQCYLTAAANLAKGNPRLVFKDVERMIDPIVPKQWPFEALAWRPNQIVKNNLKKAGALAAAEWDRLNAAGL